MLNPSKFLKHYKPELLHEGVSVIAGETNTQEIHYSKLCDAPLIQAFLDDADIQEITIKSTNIGFICTFSKQPKEK